MFLHLLTKTIKNSSLKIAAPGTEVDKTGVSFLWANIPETLFVYAANFTRVNAYLTVSKITTREAAKAFLPKLNVKCNNRDL